MNSIIIYFDTLLILIIFNLDNFFDKFLGTGNLNFLFLTIILINFYLIYIFQVIVLQLLLLVILAYQTILLINKKLKMQQKLQNTKNLVSDVFDKVYDKYDLNE